VNLVEVIDTLVEERGLDRELVTEIVCEGIHTAYAKKYPHVNFIISFNKKAGAIEIFAKKEIVPSVSDDDMQISSRKAKVLAPRATVGDIIDVPFVQAVGRIEILTAKQIIATKIRELEQLAVYKEFKDKKGLIMSGVVHKRDRGGWAIKIGDVMALLPKEGSVKDEVLKVGHPVKVLLKDVLTIARGDYQLILDRVSSEFVKKLIELEIPEVFEGMVEIKKIVRSAGYKTKIIVVSTSKDVDPVGTCVGVGGARIRPILRELGKEKVDLIGWDDSLDRLVKNSLKPADIDGVEIVDGDKAIIQLAQDQRSLAIGRLGQNIALASRLTGVEIQLEEVSVAEEPVFYADDEEKETGTFDSQEPVIGDIFEETKKD